MNTNRRPARGLTLIEVMIALAILGVASIGLAGTLVVSNNSNSMAARRTMMSAFAQARIESLTSMTRVKIPTSGYTGCAAMATGGAFDPMAPPNTGGWIMDTIDGPAPAAGGDDLLWGPILVNGFSDNGSDGSMAKTKDLRSASGAPSPWPQQTCNDASAKWKVPNCADAAVTSNVSVFCREVHIEPYTLNGAPMLRAYVRVVQGGGDWRRSYLLLQQDIAQ